MKKLLLLVFVIVLALSLGGCGELKQSIDESREKDRSAEVTSLRDDVEVQVYEKSGMKYLIVTERYSKSGKAIANLTLDSLMVEYYKKEIEILEKTSRY